MGRRVHQPKGGVYAIADERALRSRSVPEAALAMARAGVEWIQLRAKDLAGDDLYRLTAATLAALDSLPEPPALWLDDRVDIAALLPVRGVHLGQRDLPSAAAREILGPDRWIGLSTHDLEQARRAQHDSAVDVVACGPVYATANKDNPDPVVGLHGLEAIRRVVVKPLVAIGGINAERLPEILATGASAGAMIGAVCRVPDIDAACRHLLQVGDGPSRGTAQ